MTKRSRDLDLKDREILALLSRNGRMSVRDIARETGLSAPTVTERMARLKDTGVIRRFTVDVDESRTGCPVSAIIEFRPTSSDREASFDYVRQLREVRSAYVVTGSSLMVLMVRVASTDALSQFLATLNSRGETKTNVILKQVVEGRGPFPPVGSHSERT